VPPDVDLNTLDHFTASFVKWRYETVDDVTYQLDKVRKVLQPYMKEEMFANSQERAKILNAMQAKDDGFMWRYVSASSREVCRSTEGARHWGMVCDCPEHIRERHEGGVRSQHCWRNGRRLRGAWDFISTEAEKATARAYAIREVDCENDRDAWKSMKSSLLQKASGMRLRFFYLSLVPWQFSRCDTQEGAIETMKQIRSRPLEQHDPLVQIIARTHGGYIQKVADGEEPSPELVELVKFVNLSPLNEGCGEGYHRGTTQEKTRAPASSCDHLKQANRFSQEHRRVKHFILKHGERGRRVVRYEWVNWKRVLQTTYKARWSKKKMAADKAYKRIYHDDTMAQENWSLIVDPEQEPRPVVADDNTGDTQMQNEYLEAVFERHHFYGVPERREDIGEDGNPRVEEDTLVFEVLGKRGGHSRPHLMPTFASADEVVLTASCCLEIQPMRRVTVSSEIPRALTDFNGIRLMRDMAPYWIDVRKLSNFDAMSHHMLTWGKERASTTEDGILVLSGCMRAKPNRHPLASDCPTMCVVWSLQHDGWSSENNLVVARPDNVGAKIFDGRLQTKFKPYYQVLYSVDKTLPLTSAIPSREPVKFYKLLLRGVQTEPGLSDKEYTRDLNIVLKKHKKELLPLEDVPATAILPPDDDDGFICTDILPTPKPKARPKQNPGTRGGKGAKGSGRAAPPLPLPPLEAPPAPPTPPVVDPPPGPGTPSPRPPIEPIPPDVEDEEFVVVPVEEPAPSRAKPKRAARAQGRNLVPFQPGLDGAEVRYDEYPHPVLGLYKNYIIKCPVHGGGLREVPEEHIRILRRFRRHRAFGVLTRMDHSAPSGGEKPSSYMADRRRRCRLRRRSPRGA